ncbi:MAG: HupE/UreJ family protein [Chitinophagaceae bacterium]|nr:MAG: HupE/UreJ family protein [Chitinophagaceae bacterium]
MNDFGFYFGLGWEHIISLGALDHILFIAALAAIYMLKDWKQVLILVTAFTIGHTITLILSTKEWIQLDESLIEFLIPCTIAITAVFNLFQRSFSPRAIRINYFLALFFGLIHGLAFANILRMILAKEQSFAFSMFSFSIGLESGQILVVLAVLLLCQLFTQFLKVERRHWVIFVSAAVFALSLEMAAQRWPWPGERASETAQTTTTSQKNTTIFLTAFNGKTN